MCTKAVNGNSERGTENENGTRDPVKGRRLLSSLLSPGVAEQFHSGLEPQTRLPGVALHAGLVGRVEGRLSALLEQCRNPDLGEADLLQVLEGLHHLSANVYSVAEALRLQQVTRERLEARSRRKYARTNGGQGG